MFVYFQKKYFSTPLKNEKKRKLATAGFRFFPLFPFGLRLDNKFAYNNVALR